MSDVLLGSIKIHEYMDWPVEMDRGHALRTLQAVEQALRLAAGRLVVHQRSHDLYQVEDTDDGTETAFHHRATDALLEWARKHEPDLPSDA